MLDKPMTATEIREGWEKGCDCNNCEYCYVKESIAIKQKAIFVPMIKRLKEILAKNG